jgi:hypothetical protein
VTPVNFFVLIEENAVALIKAYVMCQMRRTRREVHFTVIDGSSGKTTKVDF